MTEVIKHCKSYVFVVEWEEKRSKNGEVMIGRIKKEEEVMVEVVVESRKGRRRNYSEEKLERRREEENVRGEKLGDKGGSGRKEVSHWQRR